MGYLGRRIGKSQTTANPQADGNTGGILDLFSGGYFQRTGNMPNAPVSTNTGLTATGGVISDYTDGPAVYRAHVFTSTGTFTVTAPGGFGDTVEYLVVAGSSHTLHKYLKNYNGSHRRELYNTTRRNFLKRFYSQKPR
jgi:hypothetical protein